ncbi:hypothetical protein GCM10025868_06990 [Angustibacter aerolatus]|uniref:Helicase ATP-binding domain-containing protein n=1 Tax=Angustibacter aerolatus TaxID=1162965 RepID=A0ABQ6JDD6_9ACTN|nr:DEAD/DEAH box helicase [Angustibacter aerolatus]GMA85449.1 hypothetical protein GCM10025868_06990 [Angustibacter aerolatus]
MPETPSLRDLLDAAVSGVGGVQRPGQVQMARAVEHAVEAEEHLLVQAGTGTGKSLAYLVPAIAHAVATRRPAIVATATLALQAQVVDRDLPRIADALAPALGRRPTYGLVKGRRNYLCRHKARRRVPERRRGRAVPDLHRARPGREPARRRGAAAARVGRRDGVR